MTKRVFTVTKTIGGAMQFRTWEDYAVGDIVIGTYLGIHVDQFKNDNYKIKVLDAQLEDSALAESLIGKVLVLNNCGSLNKQMEQVTEGIHIQVEYNGKALLTKGPFAGKEAHGVTVSEVSISDAPADNAENAL